MISNYRFLTVYILLFIVGFYINFHSDVALSTNKPLSEFPMTHQGWRMVSEAVFSDNILAVLKPTDYLSRRYVGTEGKEVAFYVGFHSGGKESGDIHSPKHCLPGSGWYEVSTGKKELATAGGKINLVKAIYGKGESKQLFLYWFQVRRESITNEYLLKLSEILNSMLYRRRDSAFIRVSVPFENDEELATASGEKFIKDFYPVIQSFLPN